MANYYTQFSFEIGGITPGEEIWLEKQLEQDDGEGYRVYPDYTFWNKDDDSRSLWIHDDTGGSELDVLAEMIQGFLAKFRPGDYVAFSWADTCSAPRIDSFGGGAVSITSGDILWMSTQGWITEKVIESRKEKGGSIS